MGPHRPEKPMWVQWVCACGVGLGVVGGALFGLQSIQTIRGFLLSQSELCGTSRLSSGIPVFLEWPLFRLATRRAQFRARSRGQGRAPR